MGGSHDQAAARRISSDLAQMGATRYFATHDDALALTHAVPTIKKSN
ncbi:hypothetical protein [Pandoraea sp.]